MIVHAFVRLSLINLLLKSRNLKQVNRFNWRYKDQDDQREDGSETGRI